MRMGACALGIARVIRTATVLRTLLSIGQSMRLQLMAAGT